MKPMTNNVTITVLAPNDFAEEFQATAQQDDRGITVKSVKKSDPPPGLGADLGDWASICTLVQTGVLGLQLAYSLYRVMKARNVKRIVVKSPKGAVNVSYTKNMSSEDVLEQLKPILPKSDNEQS